MKQKMATSNLISRENFPYLQGIHVIIAILLPISIAILVLYTV